MPDDKQAPKGLKIMDKRIFTPEGDIRAEFQGEIQPQQPQAATAAPASSAAPSTGAGDAPLTESAAAPTKPEAASERPQRDPGEPAPNPATPFANFLQSLIAQAYLFLGMIRDPRSNQPIYEPQAARETIDILSLLHEKTAGNLTPEEEDFFDQHLGDLKLAYVQRTKNI